MNVIHLPHTKMITITAIGIDSLLIYINKAFEGDDILCSRYHINPGSFHDCAADTYNRIIETANVFPEAQIYGMKTEFEGATHKIGFIVLIPSANVLYSFGINKSFRNDVIKSEFINFVNRSLENRTIVYLHQRNERAIRYFERNKFKVQRTLIEKEGLIIKLERCP